MREIRGQSSKAHTGFLIVLLEIIIESIMGAIWTVIKAIAQSIRLGGRQQERWRRGQSVPLARRQGRGGDLAALGSCIGHRSTNSLDRRRGK